MVGSSDFDGDVHAAGKFELLQFVHVLAVGSRMSISRLWVRCSKVSWISCPSAGALDGEFLDAGRERDRAGDARPVRLTVSAISRADWSMTESHKP